MRLYGLQHPPGCNCGSCDVQLATGEPLNIRWKKIPQAIEQQFLQDVWDQQVVTSRLHKGLWTEHFTRLRNNAEAGYGKRFNEPADLSEWELFQKMEGNLADFAAYKQQRIVEELRAIKAKGISRADWDRLAAGIMKRQNRLYLKAELNSAMAAAQAAEAWREFERRAYLYPNLRYETAGDERVRESHRALDGIVKPISDPFWDVYYPPNGWQCRCKVLQTDAPPTSGDVVDFTPPKGFSNNVGKTGRIFSEDHPYYDVSALDKEVVDKQARVFHSNWNREYVRGWASNNLVPTWAKQFQGMDMPATITNGEVNTISGKPHSEPAWRNNLLYALSLLTGEDLRYIGVAPDRNSKHPGVLQWYYYLLEIGQRKFYFNFWRRMNDDGVVRIGLHAISDTAPPQGP